MRKIIHLSVPSLQTKCLLSIVIPSARSWQTFCNLKDYMFTLLPVNKSKDTMSSVIKVLIVDDEPDICYFLSRNLSKRGFITAFSHTLAEAELQLEISKPDILLLDNYLPDGRGIDFARKINHKYTDLKIVMITAHDIPQDRSQAYNNGIDFFLSKPFTLAEINQVVDFLTGSR